MKKHTLSLFICLFLYTCSIPLSFAQSALSLEDKVEISYQAKVLVSEYQSLLNVLTNRNISLPESRILISNSYTPTGTQIFWDSLAVLEDDIDPLHTLPKRKVSDSRVPNYLNALYFLYEKSNENTIKFTNLKTSPVQEANYIFVQVIFESQFTGRHKEVRNAYQKTKRIAEVRAQPTKDGWDTKISSIIFWDPEEEFKDTTYNLSSQQILSKHSYTEQEMDSLGLVRDESGRVMTLIEFSEQKLLERLEEEAKKKAERLVNENEAQYQLNFQRGVEMMEEGEYEAAKAAFNDALEYNEYRVEPRIQLNRIQQIQKDRVRLAKVRLDNMLRKAAKYWEIKSYDKALTWYKSAYEENPQLDSLGRKIRVIEQRKIFLDRVSVGLRRGDYNNAVKEIGREIKRTPQLSDLYVLRGEAYAGMGKSKKAFDEYQEAIARFSNYREAYIKRADLYLKEQNVSQAAADYGMALTLDVEDIPLLTQRAKLNIQLNQLDEAVSDYSRAVQVAPKNPAFYMARGKLLRKQKKYRPALNDFTQATKLADGNPNAWFFKGLAFVDLHDPAGAVSAFEEAKARNLSSQSQMVIQRLGNTYFASGKRLVDQEAYGAAVDSLTGAILIDPKNIDAWYFRGVSNLAQKDILSAISDLTQVVSLSPNHAFGFFQRGNAYLANKQYQEAAQDFSNAGSLDPKLLDAHLKAGEAYGKMKRYPEALNAFQRALNLDKNNARVYFEMGNMYVFREDYSEALKSFKQALKKRKNYPEAHFNRGQLLVKLGEYSSATADFSSAIKLDPEFPEAYLERAKVYQQDGKIKEAIADYSSALTYRSNYFSAILNRGNAYYEVKAYSKALEDLERAASLDGNLLKDPDFQYKLGWSNLHAHTPKRAKAHFLQVQDLSSEELPGAVLGLGYCEVFDGNTEKGLDLMEQAFQSGEFRKKTILKNPLTMVVKKNKEFKSLVKRYLF